MQRCAVMHAGFASLVTLEETLGKAKLGPGNPANSDQGSAIRVLEKAGLKFDYRYWEPEFPEGNQAAAVYSLNNLLPAGSELAGEITDGCHSTAI